MRCRVGDLAVIVRARKAPKWLGKVVRVVRPFPGLDSWITEPMPAGFVSVFDHSLRPIRDQDGEDEMLRLVGLPQKGTA
jgi:hypothetical protein